MSYRFPPAHYRAKAIIGACAASGVGIEYLGEDCPHFRFVPVAKKFDSSFSDGEAYGEPSSRGSVTFKRKAHMKGIRSWLPVKLSVDPMYAHPMRGDDDVLTDARKCYADGDPASLRLWLEQYTAALVAAKRRNVTPIEFKAIRARAGLTQGQLAARLRISDLRTIRRYETGEREISGPVSLLMEQIEEGFTHD